MVTSHRSEGGWPGLAGPQISWLCFHYPVRGAKCHSKPSEKDDASLHTAGQRRLGGGGSCPDVTTGSGTQGGVGGPMFSVTEEHRLCCLADRGLFLGTLHMWDYLSCLPHPLDVHKHFTSHQSPKQSPQDPLTKAGKSLKIIFLSGPHSGYC